MFLLNTCPSHRGYASSPSSSVERLHDRRNQGIFRSLSVWSGLTASFSSSAWHHPLLVLRCCQPAAADLSAAGAALLVTGASTAAGAVAAAGSASLLSPSSRGGSPAMRRPRLPSICISRDTSAAFVVLYLRQTPVAESWVRRTRRPRGGGRAAAELCCCCSPSVVALVLRALPALME